MLPPLHILHTRKHLFARVTFGVAERLRSWNGVSGPVHLSRVSHRRPTMCCSESVTTADAKGRGWMSFLVSRISCKHFRASSTTFPFPRLLGEVIGFTLPQRSPEVPSIRNLHTGLYWPRPSSRLLGKKEMESGLGWILSSSDVED